MFNSSPSSPALAAAAAALAPAEAGWSAELDDVAFGCECADPSLQIACWGQDMSDGAQAAAAGT